VKQFGMTQLVFAIAMTSVGCTDELTGEDLVDTETVDQEAVVAAAGCTSTFKPTLSALSRQGEGVHGVNQWKITHSTGVACTALVDIALHQSVGSPATSFRQFTFTFSSASANQFFTVTPAFTNADVPHPFHGRFCFRLADNNTWVCQSSPTYP
jgi:hypothetical protein